MLMLSMLTAKVKHSQDMCSWLLPRARSTRGASLAQARSMAFCLAWAWLLHCCCPQYSWSCTHLASEEAGGFICT